MGFAEGSSANSSVLDNAAIKQPRTRAIAGGRDCDVYVAGPDSVLRRARDGRDCVTEARIMRYVRDRGYPVPEVHQVDGANIVMERIHGPNLYQDLARRPWRLFSHSRLLVDLQRDLAAIEPPEWLEESTECPGDRMVHLDLHPVNVLLAEHGPVVIDWTTARRGSPAADVALTWLTIAAGPVGGPAIVRVAKHLVRLLFLRQFLYHAGREQARPHLAAMLELAEDRIGRFDGATSRLERVVAGQADLRSGRKRSGRRTAPAWPR